MNPESDEVIKSGELFPKLKLIGRTKVLSEVNFINGKNRLHWTLLMPSLNIHMNLFANSFLDVIDLTCPLLVKSN